MKKLTKRCRRRVLIRQRQARRALARRRRRAVAVREHLKTFRSTVVRETPMTPIRLPTGAWASHIVIDPPEDFSLTTNRPAVDEFLACFRAEALGLGGILNRRAKRRLHVDFRKIQRLAPAAALVLAAEMDRWRRTTGVRLAVIDEGAWDPRVRQMLHDLGFFDLVDPINPSSLPAADTPIRMIRLKTGKRIPTEFTDELEEALVAIAGPLEERQYYYEAVSEALANVSHHAYPDVRPRDCTQWLPHRWWASGSFDTERRRLKILFLDQGIGIPASLPTNTAYETILGYLSNLGLANSDAEMIQAALEVGRSARPEQGGGHGLPQMQAYVNACNDGSLRIVSGRGEIIARKGQPIERLSHDSKIDGTLLEWELER